MRRDNLIYALVGAAPRPRSAHEEDQHRARDEGPRDHGHEPQRERADEHGERERHIKVLAGDLVLPAQEDDDAVGQGRRDAQRDSHDGAEE